MNWGIICWRSSHGGRRYLKDSEGIGSQSRGKKLSVLLVNPSLDTRNYTREDRLRTYLSLGALASAIRDNYFLKRFAEKSGRFAMDKERFPDVLPFPVHILNLSLKPRNQTLREYFESFLLENTFRPHLIGMTATSAQLDEAKEIAELAESLFPDALRLIGGPHVSIIPGDFLKQTPFQVACIGEGVESFIDLTLAFAAHGILGLETVPGIAYKDDAGAIHSNPPRKFIFDLDDYPFPSESLDLFLDDLHDRGENTRDLVYVLAGAGCPYRCIFCAQHAINRGRIRERSAENIFAEMEKLFDRGFRKFALVQETFLRDPTRVDRFCSRIESSGLPVEWTIEARADQLDFEKLSRMKNAGLRFVQLGVESGDQDLLNTLGKHINLTQVINVRDWCEELGIDTAYYLLVGLPQQGWQSILRSAIFLKDHLPFNRITRHISTAIAIPYPGTQINEEKTVRLMGMPAEFLNWPGRNCEVVADEEGAFLGRNFTETDEMLSEEILEAYTCLDDFGDFLLQEKHNPAFSPEERFRAREFAWHSFHMIGRRTIRDLIIRAQPAISPEQYRLSREEILSRDRGEEGHLKDLAPSAAPWPEILPRFLAAVKFQNGFQTMKILSIPNRIKWMKLCAALWGGLGENFSQIYFAADQERQGEHLNLYLENIPEATLYSLLGRVGPGRNIFELSETEKPIEILGLPFDFDWGKSLLIVKKMRWGSR